MNINAINYVKRVIRFYIFFVARSEELFLIRKFVEKYEQFYPIASLFFQDRSIVGMLLLLKNHVNYSPT